VIKIIRIASIVVAMGFCIGCVPLWSSDPKPTNWPIATDPTCLNIVGRYIDPNSIRGRTIIDTKYSHTEYGGTYDQAWYLFGFGQAVQPYDRNITDRNFLISFDVNGNLNVAYYLNQINVASKSYAKSILDCENGVLIFNSAHNDSAEFDKGSPGSTTTSVEIIKSDDKLYIKRILVMRTSFSAIPIISSVTNWQIFPSKI